MNENYTVATLKINNTKNILNYIYRQKRATPQMLHKATSLSRPTIAQILKELQEEGLIFQSGHADSTGGRKANLYEFNPFTKITIGLELLADHYELVAVDLYAETLKFEKFTLSFSDSAEYFEEVCTSVNQFIESLKISPERILGVGIALQALISADGKRIIYGKILNCTGLDIEEFGSRIPYPCTFNHDAESNANVELWMNPMLKNAIYFNIRSDLSGAIIIDRKYFKGGEYKSGVFEHMTIVPGGAPCYCGKRGCVNSYCSISALLKPQEDIQQFFFMLRKGTDSYKKRWDKYLEYLAMAVDNLHMAINCNIILGGNLSRYLVNEDIIKLHELVNKRTAFPTTEQYIGISSCANIPLCIGAALPFIEKYKKSIM
ncbi:ROK family transcriptional regulator [Faecalicatena contorta]|uniref:Sugar kinase of the NBD/HSP70 family, may contain an N-terminal HTH domain n=1 Tax=Faecalicatena contorta TaxID=39482 RepID=A0A316A081_9FIRM|nr:ROK family transcriptional regulator [Faecalicatena contorta]PWJ50550.1 putative NBD/HSP70 family sugar kinase [Faecalicatena contorta]SUQ13958.1 Sugar kinase of the NBD/HSP70 family, may contain an N-terminal HTH domain [Faecalicatena contorta]